ncbi:serine hydrolase [Caenimonas sedimenti]|uniref:Serine hydrolase n=1 Tax=Caenimonas sedimenti TaxID=2596921 RepID=A0A562ZWH7_9BURK|nr:serine hydrolase domain-containing protein [Caenimonas sedimenti]TWO72979.1 serine hydrolase [Caenimonas sedimenti]
MFFSFSAARDSGCTLTRGYPALRACFTALVSGISTVAAFGQILPSQGTTPSAPDEWLFGTGPSWYYRASPSPVPREVGFRKPTSEEAEVVRKAEALLAGSSGKAMALISGNEVVWAGFKPPASRSRLFMGFSMGKTVTALAVGKAICAGKLKLDSLAGDLLPELNATDLGAASVRDLLRMTSGTWEGNRDSTVWSREEREAVDSGRSNWLQFLATSKAGTAEKAVFGKRKPGSDFHYHSTAPLTLGLMLQAATGATYARWVEDEVLHAMGTSSPAIVGQDRKEYGQADGTVRMTFDDWVRFAVWVKESHTAPGCFGDYVRELSKVQVTDRAKTGRIGFLGYGYLTWIGTLPTPNSFWAVGYGGQRIAWNPSNGRILIVFSNVENYMDEVAKLYGEWAKIP